MLSCWMQRKRESRIREGTSERVQERRGGESPDALAEGAVNWLMD